jgi:ribonuclease PH
MNSAGNLIELQGTGEESTFSEAQLSEMLRLGKSGILQLLDAQKKALQG